ncbi:efflux RND transporter periplasmic adaptor subunit [Gilvimarinus chinensis]|uniref:efflux RND transporter periplasmic adaptor subunit n=1 Tax=Gilvimarinus chinensis TaxID=396005 RepID=UPI000369619E|nr:efflux RND transporter periplasmic adaptor subunit [Gilvimarinus chinensis]
MKTLFAVVLAAALGLVAGWLLFAQPLGIAEQKQSASETKQPLYWVAPMDSSYRRNGPGKSPMGMDLVPVYAESEQASSGDVVIAPNVVQQLGVSTFTVERQSLTPRIDAVGFVSFDEQALVHLHLRATGWVSGLAVNSLGDPVTRGQKLFDFYSPDIRNTQQEFLQALAGDNPRLVSASREKLRAQGVPESEIAAIEKSRQIKSEISYYALKSGVVASLSVANGSYVTLQENALSIGPLEQVWVIAEVFERQAGLLAAGQQVSLSSRAYPERKWQGTVDYVYPVLNPANRTTRARIVVANDARLLKPNMLMDIRVTADALSPQLVVPDNAVIRTGAGDRVVREVRPGVFRSAAVALGQSAGGFTQIVSGLNAGDKVVTRAQFLIDSESNVAAELDRLNADEVKPNNIESGSLNGEKTTPHSVDHSSEAGDASSKEGGNHGQMNHSHIGHHPIEHEPMNDDDKHHGEHRHD